MTAIIRWARHAYLVYFSTPPGDRFIYRLVKKRKCRRILEIGIATAQRAQRMIELARPAPGGPAAWYTGMDLFEMRGERDPAGISLKKAHRALVASGARIQLVPGDPFAALARSANDLGKFDLILVSAGVSADSMKKAWFYIPRLMHGETLVIAEAHANGEAGRPIVLARSEVERLAAMAVVRKVA